METKQRTKVWFDSQGCLRTNNPQAFSKEFYVPETPPTDDGLVRVSYPLKDTKKAD